VACGLPASLSIVDLANPAAPKMTQEVALGDAPPSGIAVRGEEVYISQQSRDVVSIVNGSTAKVEGQIPLRIAGLESYRGIAPLGLAFDEKSGRLLVAESGINAVGVIDAAARKVVGQIPAGWFPDAIAVHDGHVYVASARGVGTGPSTPAHRIRMTGGGKGLSFEVSTAVLRRGIVGSFDVPAGDELAHQTEVVMQANGFAPVKNAAPSKDPKVRYVVLIVKGNRAFDELLGDVQKAGDKVVMAEPSFARFGPDGYVSGGKQRFSLHTDITPNHHEIAARWSFADNYYADSDYGALTYRWLTGEVPDLWSEMSALYEEAGNQEAPRVNELRGGSGLWDHLTRHQVEFRDFSEKRDNVKRDDSDQRRADQFIDTLRKDYLEAGKALPRFLLLGLPNDAAGPVRPDEGYPYEASYVADNDYALGRVVEFLSGTPWWKEMAIFVTESGADAGADHVDSHRMLLLGVGPWFRSNYVSHSNASSPALLRTIFKVLDVPPMNLYDVTAGDLMDLFGVVPDFSPYEAKREDVRLFDAEKVR
jgi:YVTN family beta-propeller protein